MQSVGRRRSLLDQNFYLNHDSPWYRRLEFTASGTLASLDPRIVGGNTQLRVANIDKS